jgi:hypothetical protein
MRNLIMTEAAVKQSIGSQQRSFRRLAKETQKRRPLALWGTSRLQQAVTENRRALESVTSLYTLNWRVTQKSASHK